MFFLRCFLNYFTHFELDGGYVGSNSIVPTYLLMEQGDDQNTFETASYSKFDTKNIFGTNLSIPYTSSL